MKKNLRKTAAVLIVAALLAACGGNSGGSSSSGSSSGTSSSSSSSSSESSSSSTNDNAAADDAPADNGLEPYPVGGYTAAGYPLGEFGFMTLKVWKDFSSTIIKDLSENRMFQELEKATGVKIN